MNVQSVSGDAAASPGLPAVVPALVDAAWCLEHLHDPGVRFVEVDERPDRCRFEQGHLPGAVSWIWEVELVDPVRRDIAPRGELTALLRQSGIDAATHVVLYGDPSNWFAAWAHWLLRLHGVERVSLLDGGRSYWVARGLPITTDASIHAPTSFDLPEPTFAWRAFRDDVLRGLNRVGTRILDVRSPGEYRGDPLAVTGTRETAQRSGHIPGAISVPWDEAVKADGTFKSIGELTALYTAAGVDAADEVIAYCRIGERSSHTWFVLHELLGYPSVRNYDGSWVEWGSSVGLPIAR